MRHRVDSALFSTFPDFTRAVVVARDLDIDSSVGRKVERRLRRDTREVRGRLSESPVSEHPRIACWGEAYQAFGMAEEDYPSSLEVLVRQALGEGDIKTNSILANLLTTFSLRHLVPCLGDDASRISGDVWLRLARGREFFTPVGGGKPQSPQLGEVIYVDSGEVVLARRWNGQPGDQTRLNDRTRQCILTVDCLPPVDRSEAQELGDELSGMVQELFGGEASTRLITHERPVIEIPEIGEEPPPMRGQRIGG